MNLSGFLTLTVIWSWDNDFNRSDCQTNCLTATWTLLKKYFRRAKICFDFLTCFLLHKPVGFLFLFFPRCSLFPPFFSSFTIFLGLELHNSVNLSYTAGTSVTWSLACRAHFFRFWDVINLFTQREIASISALVVTSEIRPHILKIWSRAFVEVV